MRHGEEQDELERDEPEVRHQPASPADLERFPPRDEVCRGIREMLRDHCDGELTGEDLAQVDDHVHECRDCALALSRMELEVFRLRQAVVDESAMAAEVPDDFVRGVMGRVGALLLEDDETPPLFTSRVMERVRREWRPPPLWKRVVGTGRRGVRRRWAAAAVLVVALGSAIGLGSWFGLAEPRGARFDLVAVTDAQIESGDGAVRVARPGTPLDAGDRLTTGTDGAAMVERIDERQTPLGRPIPATRGSRIALDPEGVVRVLPAGGLALLAGTASIETEEPFELTVPGSAQVAVDGGAVVVTVDEVRRHDSVLAAWPLHRVRVEVVTGRVRLLRGTTDVAVVGEGQVARFDSWSTVEIEAAPTFDLIARSARAARAPAVAEVVDRPAGTGSESWTGRVVDGATGRGIELASVEIRVGGEAVEQTRTDADGWFRFTSSGGGAPSAAIAIVRVLPPDGPDAEWAAYGPEPIALEARGAARARRLSPIALRPDVPVRGVVLRAGLGRVAGARVVPCIVDELFAMVEPIEDLAAETDEGGAFTLRGLPGALPRHQTLALLIEKRGLPRHVRLDLGGRRGAVPSGPLEVLVPEPRDVTVAGLTPGRELRVIREIPGVPLAAMSEAILATADTSGRAVLRAVGPGALWMIGDLGADLRRLVAAASGDGTLVASADVTRPWSDVARLQSEPKPLADRDDPISVVTKGRRLDVAVSPVSPRAARFVAVQDDTRVFGERTRLYLQSASGALRYLGEVDGSFALPFVEPAERPFRIVAVGANGAIGVLTGDEFDARQGEIAMLAPGAVAIGEDLRGSLEGGGLVAFDLLDGPLAGRRFWRLVDAQRGFEAGDLPPGSYTTTLPDGTSWTCTVASGGCATLARSASRAEGDESGR